MFLAPKVNYCFTMIEDGISERKKTYKGFQVANRLLEREQCFGFLEGITIILAKRVGKKFDGGVVIP